MNRIVTFFLCHGWSLPAIIDGAGESSEVGVLIVVGGPQYRVGSHRQFVLLARHLARCGVPCMRFDYRGMGDAEGDAQDFEDCAPDIDAAVATFLAQCPQVRRVVLWGLCDGASAAAFHAVQDSRVAGMVLLNPWVRTDRGESGALVSGYYGRRLMSADFWRKLARGELAVWRSAMEFLRHWRRSRGHVDHAVAGATGLWQRERPLPQRLAQALKTFGGPVLIVLSGNDLVAAEFRNAAVEAPLADACRASHVRWCEVDDATHTFSSAEWRGIVENVTVEFVRAL